MQLWATNKLNYYIKKRNKLSTLNGMSVKTEKEEEHATWTNTKKQRQDLGLVIKKWTNQHKSKEKLVQWSKSQLKTKRSTEQESNKSNDERINE